MKLTRLIAAATLALGLAAGAAHAGEKLVIATEGAYPPYNFVAADGSLQGFDVEIANALCAKLQAECTIIKQDWDGMIPGLIAKKYDVIVASMGILPEREEKVDFTIPYYMSPTAMVAYKTSGITAGADGFPDPASLKGKSVGVQRATSYESFMREKFKDANIKVYDTSESADLDLTAGRLDARFDDAIVLMSGVLKSDVAADLAQVGKPYPETAFGSKGEGIAVRKGEDDLRKRLNDAILAIRADGTYKQINDKYFTFDIYGQ